MDPGEIEHLDIHGDQVRQRLLGARIERQYALIRALRFIETAQQLERDRLPEQGRHAGRFRPALIEAPQRLLNPVQMQQAIAQPDSSLITMRIVTKDGAVGFRRRVPAFQPMEALRPLMMRVSVVRIKSEDRVVAVERLLHLSQFELQLSAQRVEIRRMLSGSDEHIKSFFKMPARAEIECGFDGIADCGSRRCGCATRLSLTYHTNSLRRELLKTRTPQDADSLNVAHSLDVTGTWQPGNPEQRP